MLKKFADYVYFKEQEGVDSPFTSSKDTSPVQPPAQPEKKATPLQAKPKWKMTKSDILKFWQSLPVGLPIAMNPIAADHEGSTFSEDAIRITGSTEFIKSVLCRLKEFIAYESDKTKLNISFRETSSPSLEQEGLAKTSYVFYLQTKERG